MAVEKAALKNGMGGSRCGKGRRAGTALLKNASKKRRRQASKAAAKVDA